MDSLPFLRTSSSPLSLSECLPAACPLSKSSLFCIIVVLHFPKAGILIEPLHTATLESSYYLIGILGQNAMIMLQ